MENKPKKSKALIITIIAIIILLIVGFLIYKNRDVFGVKTSNNIAKIFSPLTTSSNTKNTIAQAGENIKEGDKISYAGKNANNNSIVMKATGDDDAYGFALEDILAGDTGKITLGTKKNSFWNSISNFLNSNKNPDYLPQCNDDKDGDGDGLIDELDPNCHIGGDLAGEYVPDHVSESVSPSGTGSGLYLPQCNDDKDGDGDGLIDELDPNCHIGGDLAGEYVPDHVSESVSPSGTGSGLYPSQCDDGLDNDRDEKIDNADPNCHIDGDLTKEYVPSHYSEATSPFGTGGGLYPSQCDDGLDNDRDEKIDNADPNCHIDGDLTKEYVPSHYSEATSPLGNNQNPDLVAGNVSPTSTTIDTPTILSSVITNRGVSATLESFSSFFTITTVNPSNKTDSTKDIELSTVVPTLGPGVANVTTTSYTFTTNGVYYARACADKKSSSDNGMIKEVNEDNNCGSWTTITISNSLPIDGSLPECSDNNDNDNDGKIDSDDPSCHLYGDLDNEYLPEYDSEENSPVECNDTIDNDDDDSLIDEADPQCHKNGDLQDRYLPTYNSESTNSVECNDTIDNDDDDSLIDEADPECHEKGILTGLYVPSNDSEEDSPAEPNVCLYIEQNPITFTDEEQADLAELLRKFYLIAPTLKTEEDIKLVYSDIIKNQNSQEQLNTLIKECYLGQNDRPGYTQFCAINPEACDSEDSFNSRYTGPTTKYGNPWFKYNTRGSYIQDGKYNPSYCTKLPNTENPHNFDSRKCPTFKTQLSCEKYGTRLYMTGCTWVVGTDLGQYEKILNVW